MSNTAGAAISEEQRRLLEEGQQAVQGPSRFGRGKIIAIAGVAAVVAVAAVACRGRPASGAATWKGGHVAFLAETKRNASIVQSVGVDATNAYAAAADSKVKKDLLDVEALKESAAQEATIAEAIQKLEASEIAEGKETLTDAAAIKTKADTESNSAKVISKMAEQDMGSAKTLEKQAISDIAGAKEIMHQNSRSASGVADIAKQQLADAESERERAEKQISSSSNMTSKANHMMDKAADMVTAEKVMNATAVKEIAAEKDVKKLAMEEIARTKNMTAKAKALEQEAAKDKALAAKVHAEAQDNTATVQKANADIASAKTAHSEAIQKQKQEKENIDNSQAMYNMSQKEEHVVSIVKKQLAAQTESFHNLSALGAKTDDKAKFEKIEAQQAQAVTDAQQRAASELTRAEALRKNATTIEAKSKAALKAAVDAQKAAENKTADAKAALAEVNSKEHVAEGKKGELDTLTEIAQQDKETAADIAGAAKGLAGLLAESKGQANGQLKQAQYGETKADKLLEVAAEPLKDLVAGEKQDAAEKEKQTVTGVETVKHLAGNAKQLQSAAEAEQKAAEAKGAQMPEEHKEAKAESAASAAPQGLGCCSYEGSGVCGKPNGYCDASAENCSQCGKGEYIKLTSLVMAKK